MDLLNRIGIVLASDPNDAQLDKFLSDVRDSLSASNRQFLAFQVTTVVSIVVYHLIVYGGGTSIAFGGVQISDTGLFRRTFLVFPSALLAATACIGYLRKLQRECFDFLAISRYRVLGTTGLHELRLPADYALGVFMLREVGGVLGKNVSSVVMLLTVVAFIFAPTFYVINEAINNIRVFGFADWLCVAASLIAIVLSACGLIIIRLSGKIQTSLNLPVTTKPPADSSAPPAAKNSG